jgi:hypothetical protein
MGRYTLSHPELVSGSISVAALRVFSAQWMLKQVQHDDKPWEAA